VRLPQPFGKYLLLERISVGGMAEVFKAKAFGVEGFEKIIAIKKILPSMAEDADFIQMFIDEAKICSQLNHANVCQVFELGKIEESHFIAMEYIWGKDLLQIQNRFRRLRKNMSLQQAAFVASKVCEGLDYAHRKKDANGKPLNIIHRDVSPQNIIVSYEGEAKVIDFGIAKAASRSSKTQAGVLKGKFGYMSPEQVGGKTLDRRADVFAIGTILYEILTNERLFLGESDFATLEKVRNVSIPPPSQVRKDIPEALDKIIMKALAKETEQRYQWASEMADDLQDFLAQNEPVYNSKQLSLWMRENFASEMKKEGQVLEEQRKIGKEAMSTGPARKQTVPPSARLKAAPSPGGAASAASLPPKAPEPAPEAEEGHTLIEEPAEDLQELDEDKAPAPLAGEATAIVMPGQSPVPGGGEIPGEATRVLDPSLDKPPGDLPGQATQVFNPGEHQPAPPPAAPQPPPQQMAPPIIAQMDPYAASALMAAGQMPMQPGMMPGQNPSMVGPMVGFPQGMQMPGMPYGTGAFAIVPAPGGTGMMMLPQGMVPGMFPGQVAPPARGGLLKDVLIGVGVAIAVVALVLGVKFALTPGKGTVILTVIPPHAGTIYIDGKEHGRLDANNAYVIRDLPRGPHLMLVRADDGEAQQAFDLTTDLLQLAVQLSAANGGSTPPSTPSGNPSQGSGTIRLRLPPEGALVSINGRLVSEKEVQKGFLVPAGVPNEVKVSKAGKREERFTVTLSAGQEVERTIELKDGRGKLSITSKPPGADVLVNGRVYGKSPLTVEDLDPTKPVKLTLKKRGSGTVTRTVSFDSSLEQTLDIDLGGSSGKEDDRPSSSPGGSSGSGGTSSGTAAVGGADGFLIANTHPWAKVFIDNKDTGKTTPIGPRDRIPVKPGKHTITFVTNDKRLSVEVVIRPGEESKIVRDLNDSN
jgi:serine/threonine protein kinase